MAENTNTPGAELSKSEKAIKKMEEIKGKIDGVSGKIAGGLTMLKYATNGLGGIVSSISNIEENSYDTIQDLKKQAKGMAIQRVKEEIPSEDEIREKLKGYSCDLEVIKAIKKTKETLEFILGKGKRTVESVLKRLEKLHKKTEKSTETITTITIILGIFRVLVTALEILVTAASLALAAFVGLWNAAKPVDLIQQAIKKAESFILKYTSAIKAYTNYILKVLGVVMTLFNLIPIIIGILNTLLNIIIGFIDLIAKLFADLIKGCIPEGDMIIGPDPNDGSYNIDPSKLQNFLNTNLDHGNNLYTPGIPGRYGDYIHDDSEKQHRIYRPKIGTAKPSTSSTSKPTGYHTPGTPAYLNRFRPGGDLYGRTPAGYHTKNTPAYLNRFSPGGDLYGRIPEGYHTPGTPAWLHRFRPGGDKENDPKPTGWWTKGHQNYHKNYT